MSKEYFWNGPVWAWPYLIVSAVLVYVHRFWWDICCKYCFSVVNKLLGFSAVSEGFCYFWQDRLSTPLNSYGLFWRALGINFLSAKYQCRQQWYWHGLFMDFIACFILASKAGGFLSHSFFLQKYTRSFFFQWPLATFPWLSCMWMYWSDRNSYTFTDSHWHILIETSDVDGIKAAEWVRLLLSILDAMTYRNSWWRYVKHLSGIMLWTNWIGCY